MEYFDVYDVNRKSLGYTKERGTTLDDNEYNMGVEFWIFNNHKLLMTKRSLQKSHPLEWEVPGGCSQAGETSLDTLHRESGEEIGVDLKDNYKLIGTKLYKKMFVDIYLSDIKIDINNIKLQEEEVCDIAFISKDEFLKLNEEGKIVKSVFDRYEYIKGYLEKNNIWE